MKTSARMQDLVDTAENVKRTRRVGHFRDHGVPADLADRLSRCVDVQGDAANDEIGAIAAELDRRLAKLDTPEGIDQVVDNVYKRMI